MELMAHESTQEELMALYHQVYQLKRDLGEVPCSKDTAEEIHIEILETLKACLWHRQGPTQLEELRGRSVGTKTTRMPAQAEFHVQTQVTWGHFGCF